MQFKSITAIIVLLLVVASLSVAGCTQTVNVEPGHATVSNAPTGSGTNYDVSISAREVPMVNTSLITSPTPGNKLVAIECSLKDNNVANLFTVWREWTAKDANGTLYQEDTNTVVVSNGYPKTTIQPGDTARGIIVYQIPVNAKIVSMRYTDETTQSHTLICNVTK